MEFLILDFELHLKDVNELFIFNPSNYDPFNPNDLGEAAIEHMLSRVGGQWFRPPKVRAVVYLPKEKVTPDLEQKTRVALRNYYQSELIENWRVISEYVKNNLIFLGVAVLIAIGGLWLSPRIAQTSLISDPELRAALAFGIDILIWVVLWTPVSALVLEWFPYFRQRQAFRAMSKMDLVIKPE